MLFSIITVIRDNHTGIHKTAANLAAQEFEDFEWIVIDRAADSRKHAAYSMLEHTIIHDSESNETEAFAHALSVARGKYILFLRPNEVFAQTQTLQKLSDSIEFSGPDLVYGDYWQYNKGRTKYKAARSHLNLQHGLFTSFSSILFRKELICNMEFNSPFKKGAELNFTHRAAERSHSILYLPMAISAGEFTRFPRQSFFSNTVSRKVSVMQLLNWGLFHAQPRLYRSLIPTIADEIPIRL